MKVTQKPVTYEAEQFTDIASVKEIDKILKGTGVSFVGSGRTRLQWPGTGFYENGPDIRVWEDDWVVVSSTGNVRKLTPKEYDAEFYEHWEEVETPEQKIALLAHYVNSLVTLSNDKGELSVDIGDWSKLEQLGYPR